MAISLEILPNKHALPHISQNICNYKNCDIEIFFYLTGDSNIHVVKTQAAVTLELVCTHLINKMSTGLDDHPITITLR